MAINKVVFGNEVKMDLTNDSVSADNLLEGETAHDRSGSPVVGTAKQGHSILDRLGTLLTQRSKLKFGGMLKTTDDATNGVTEVSDLAEEVEWSVWNAMSEAQRTAYSAGKKLDIINVPSVSGSIPVELIKTLWTNQNPTSAFVAQSVDLSSSDYDFLIINYIATVNGRADSAIIAKNQLGVMTTAYTNGDNYTYATIVSRVVNFTDVDTVSFGDAVEQNTTQVRTKNNNRCIPIAIYGIKSSVNVDMSALVANVSTSASKCMLSDGETSVEEVLTASALPSYESYSTTDYSTIHTFGSDGYLRVVGSSGTALLIGSDGNSVTIYPNAMVNVKKGMKCRVVSAGLTVCEFWELS